jgi:hypothetical protein
MVIWQFVSPANGSGTRAGPLVAAAGDSVFTSDGLVVNLFQRPAGGWAGTMTPAAQLTRADGAAICDELPATVAEPDQQLVLHGRPRGLDLVRLLIVLRTPPQIRSV